MEILGIDYKINISKIRFKKIIFLLGVVGMFIKNKNNVKETKNVKQQTTEAVYIYTQVIF